MYFMTEPTVNLPNGLNYGLNVPISTAVLALQARPSALSAFAEVKLANRIVDQTSSRSLLGYARIVHTNTRETDD